MSAVPAPSSDTIAAIATASGPGGIGIVRLSGPAAFAVADRVTRGKVSAARQPHSTLRRVKIIDPSSNEEIDDGLRAIFRSPHSFTGEDVVEIHGHGGTVVLTRTFAACLAAGARAARPGEFSERAFLNGKLDLAQAEAVAALVQAGTVEAQRAARRQLSGDLSRVVGGVSESLKAALARIEASIDFPEEVGEVDTAAVDTLLEDAAASFSSLLSAASYGRHLREGVRVVIAGRPNAGKSSLLNALAGVDRAIVSPIPGTTRDLVEETLNFGGIPVRAIDTAGIRATDDPIESIGVERARRAISDADAVIAVLDATAAEGDDSGWLSEAAAGTPLVFAVNKSDAADPRQLLAAAEVQFPDATAIAVSAVTGVGLEELRSSVATVLGATVSADPPLVTSARHEDALRRAAEAVACARATLANGLPAELIAVDAHGALQALGEITGETAREEIIAGIFATFCIGK